MEAVVVTAQAKTIDNKIDRLVFNAEKDISSQTGTASDILKKVPQVSVDADGNVQLAGSSGVRFLINGKPFYCLRQQRGGCTAVYSGKPDKKHRSDNQPRR
jgi:hypothetical protein